MTRRFFDAAASLVGLVALSPVMGVIAVLIKRDSRGPIIFRQERIGWRGRTFMLLKFRSMVTDDQASGPLITSAGDMRITRVGAVLRSTKLDELPQLVNVLRGDMSIVGPRPEVAKYVTMWSEEDRRVILSVRPGITDPATLRFRREEDLLAEQTDPEDFYRRVLLPQKVRIYREYVRSRSFAGDLGIIMQTFMRIVRG